MTATPAFTGRVRRLPDGTIGGEMREAWSSWPVHLVLTPGRDEQGAYYEIAGYLGDTPPALRLPGESADRTRGPVGLGRSG